VRGIFFDEDDARAAALALTRGGFEATVVRERLAGEDDDEDHPWAVVTDAPAIQLEMLVETYDGWLDEEDGGFEARKLAPQPPRADDAPQPPRADDAPQPPRGEGAPQPPLPLPDQPRRIKRPD